MYGGNVNLRASVAGGSVATLQRDQEVSSMHAWMLRMRLLVPRAGNVMCRGVLQQQGPGVGNGRLAGQTHAWLGRHMPIAGQTHAYSSAGQLSGRQLQH